MKLGRQRNYHKGRAAIRHYANLRKPWLQAVLCNGPIPASRDRDNVTHWGWRHRATEDGWRSFRDDMHDAEPQFYSVSEITVCLCKTKSPVSLCLPIFASLETTTQCHGFLYRVPQKYRPKVNGFRSHPVHVCLHLGTFCLVELLIIQLIASKLYCIV